MPNDMMEMPLPMKEMARIASVLMNRKIAYVQRNGNNVAFYATTEFHSYAWKTVFWIDGDVVLYHPWRNMSLEGFRRARAKNLLDWVNLILWRLRQGR